MRNRLKRGLLMQIEMIRWALRSQELARSQSEIAREVGISSAMVQDYTRRAMAVELSADAEMSTRRETAFTVENRFGDWGTAVGSSSSGLGIT